jgi:hypothetical protein
MCLDLVANTEDYTTIIMNENKCDLSAFRVSGGFHVKLMKIKLQGLSIARAPSKALGGALIMHYKLF